MNIIADTHCHTVASVHAYSTILENIHTAKKNGLDVLAITDHTGTVPGAPGPWYFDNLKILPKEIEGIKILRGIETNVLGASGEVEMPELKFPLDWVIASIHDVAWHGNHDIDDCTNAWISVAKNPIVNVIGHSGVPGFEYNIEKVIPIFGENNKLVEINSSSFKVRKGSYDNCFAIANCCKKHKVSIVVNSDAHICEHVGNFDDALKLLKDIDFPNELIINADKQRFKNYLKKYTDFFS
jgi:putative hydrolase